MDEDTARQWVKLKDNRKAILAHLLKDFPPTKEKIAFFMAGIPGAGKTELAESIMNEATVTYVPIEHDKLVEYMPDYRPEIYYNYRRSGSALVTDLYDTCLRNGYAFVFDGTLSHESGIRNIGKAIKAGYQVYIWYVVQDIRVAWELTQARELVKHRAIEKSGFLDTCTKINTNLLTIFMKYKDVQGFNFFLLNKYGAPGMEDAEVLSYFGGLLGHDDKIEKQLSKSYNINEIE